MLSSLALPASVGAVAVGITYSFAKSKFMKPSVSEDDIKNRYGNVKGMISFLFFVD